MPGVTGRHRFWSWDATMWSGPRARPRGIGSASRSMLAPRGGLFDRVSPTAATLPTDALDAALDRSLRTQGRWCSEACRTGASPDPLLGARSERRAGDGGRGGAALSSWRMPSAETEFEPAYDESRSWHGRHRHVSVATSTFAMSVRVRRRGDGAPHELRGSVVWCYSASRLQLRASG